MLAAVWPAAQKGEEIMGRKIMAAALIMVLAITLFSCKKDKAPDPQEIADLVVAACDEISLDIVPAAHDAVQEYFDAKEKAEEKKREKERKKREAEEEDDEDPVNADSTKETGQNATVDEMTKRYIGRWEQQGIIQSDGNLDTSNGSHCTYVFNSDYTYTARGKDASGKKIKEDGTWTLNSNKQIVAGKYTMGIDESGYLLKDTGERDGKGRKMKYAFSKVS